MSKELSAIMKAGVKITPIPTPRNNGLRLKVEVKGKEKKGSQEKVYSDKEVWKVYWGLVDFYYKKLK